MGIRSWPPLLTNIVRQFVRYSHITPLFLQAKSAVI